MLFIEKGGPAQIPDELAAYNPLIPQGSELVATVMFEIDDPIRRARVLATLGGVEDKAFLRVGAETIRGVPEERPGTHARGRQGILRAVPALSVHAGRRSPPSAAAQATSSWASTIPTTATWR